MIAPGCAAWSPQFFTLSILGLESQPFLVLLDPFLCTASIRSPGDKMEAVSAIAMEILESPENGGHKAGRERDL
jgi:hypothetical protein